MRLTWKKSNSVQKGPKKYIDAYERALQDSRNVRMANYARQLRENSKPIDPRTEFSGEEHDMMENTLSAFPGGPQTPFMPNVTLTGDTGKGDYGSFNMDRDEIRLRADRFIPDQNGVADSGAVLSHEYGHFFDAVAEGNKFYDSTSVIPKLDQEERADSYGYALRTAAGEQPVAFKEYRDLINRVLEHLKEFSGIAIPERYTR